MLCRVGRSLGAAGARAAAEAAARDDAGRATGEAGDLIGRSVTAAICDRAALLRRQVAARLHDHDRTTDSGARSDACCDRIAIERFSQLRINDHVFAGAHFGIVCNTGGRRTAHRDDVDACTETNCANTRGAYHRKHVGAVIGGYRNRLVVGCGRGVRLIDLGVRANLGLGIGFKRLDADCASKAGVGSCSEGDGGGFQAGIGIGGNRRVVADVSNRVVADLSVSHRFGDDN